MIEFILMFLKLALFVVLMVIACFTLAGIGMLTINIIIYAPILIIEGFKCLNIKKSIGLAFRGLVSLLQYKNKR